MADPNDVASTQHQSEHKPTSPDASSGRELPALDDLFASLEDIVTQLEAGEQPLEDALALFAQGIQLCRQGTQRLDATEAAIEKLIQGSDGDDVAVPLKNQ